MKPWIRLGVLLLSLLTLARTVQAQAIFNNGHVVTVGSENYCDTTGSGANAYACSLLEVITEYNAGGTYRFKANAANTGAATLQLNAIASPVPIVKVQGGVATALIANDIRTGQMVEVEYDGTNMQMVSQTGNLPPALAANGANCTVAGTFPNGVDASGVAENCVTLSAVNAQTTTYQVLAADFDGYKTITVASGTFTITLVASGGSQPAAGKYLRVLNYGSGVVTIARSGQNLNGAAANLTMPVGSTNSPSFAVVLSDGTNYFAEVGGGKVVRGLAFTIGDPAGSTLTVASTTTDYLTVPFACTIAAYNLLVDAGTITVKFWKVATGTAIPTSAASINTSGVGISTGTAVRSTTLTDFTSTAVAANDIVAMNVTAVTTAKFVQGTLQCEQ